MLRGVPDTGNDWREFRTVPRSHPLRPFFCTSVFRGGNRRAFRLPGEGGDHFHCTVEPSPGHIRCRRKSTSSSHERSLERCARGSQTSWNHCQFRTPTPQNLLNFAFLPFFLKKEGKGPKTPKFSKSALPYKNTQKMDLVNFGGVVGCCFAPPPCR